MFMKKSEAINRYEAEAAILEKIAKKFQKGSRESEVLKKAGFALFFATIQHSSEFGQFLLDAVREPTPEEKERLRKMGIKMD
jgi:hypothetical protein